MQLRRIAAVTVLATLICAAPSNAQHKQDAWTGSRVRVTAPNFLDQRITGTVSSINHDAISLRDEVTGEAYKIPLQAIARLDRFKGDSRANTAWRRARFGAFVGGSAGLVAGPFLAKADGLMGDLSFGQSLTVSTAAGLVGGAAVGAVLGALFPSEHWDWSIRPWGYDANLRPRGR